ncbi:MAG: cell division protein FtsZ [Deltaproteobacteria bacterium]|nr:cell division protein FtsZ [Deltaproteobacteria bacterium]
MEFEFVENQKAARIKVIGIGGAGNNAVNNMIASGLSGVAFIAANTDLQALENNTAPTKLQLGATLTKGLGCGANPEVGREAALEDLEKIHDTLSDSDMIFLTVGMGGGTGTGGAPVIAEALHGMDQAPLTVAVVTKPFHFEGKRRMRQAEEGIERLKEYADTIISIPNNRLIAMAPRGCGLKEAFKMADDVLMQAVKGVSDLILVPGLINLDFADAQTVMARKGMALMGTGMASGPDRSTVAAEKAVSSPLLDDISVKGAQGLLINIASAEDNISLDEVDEACSLIQQEVHEDATVIFGVAWDNSLGDNIRITVIATGIGQKRNEERIVTLESADILDRPVVPTLEEIHQDRTGEYDRPSKERQGKTNISQIKQPRYTNFEEVFSGVDEDLEKPTFMRRQAD